MRIRRDELAAISAIIANGLLVARSRLVEDRIIEEFEDRIIEESLRMGEALILGAAKRAEKYKDNYDD